MFLDDIYQAYKRNPALENLMVDKEFGSKLVNSEKAWRSVVIKVLELIFLSFLSACKLQLQIPAFLLATSVALDKSEVWMAQPYYEVEQLFWRSTQLLQ